MEAEGAELRATTTFAALLILHQQHEPPTLMRSCPGSSSRGATARPPHPSPRSLRDDKSTAGGLLCIYPLELRFLFQEAHLVLHAAVESQQRLHRLTTTTSSYRWRE
ncbi:unnamed protein product [Urochloa humidicola]